MRKFLGYPLWTLFHTLFVVPLCVILYMVPVPYTAPLYTGSLMLVCALFVIGTMQYTCNVCFSWSVGGLCIVVMASLWVVALSLFIGSVTREMYQNKPSLGVGHEHIVEITGSITEDSRRNSYGNPITVLEMSEAISSDGGRFSAKGVVSLRLGAYETYLPYWGERVVVQGSFSKDGSRFYGKDVEFLKWNSWLFRLRSHVVKYVERRILSIPSQGSELLLALLLGRKIDPQGWEYTLFRKAGAAHILALSGMHLAIIAGCISKIFSKLLGKRGALKISLPCIAVYLFIAGFTPSLVRGAILYGVVTLYKLKQIRVYLFHILVITFGVQVVLFPNAPYELAFQLSYLALGGILLFSTSITPYLLRLPSYIRSGIAGGISAQLTTVPLVLITFGSWYPIGIISGIILVPLITLFIWIGLCMIFLPSGGVLQVSSLGMDYLYRLIIVVAQWSSLAPGVHRIM